MQLKLQEVVQSWYRRCQCHGTNNVSTTSQLWTTSCNFS